MNGYDNINLIYLHFDLVFYPVICWLIEEKGGMALMMTFRIFITILKKITIKSNNVGTFRRTITNGISHLFCISFL